MGWRIKKKNSSKKCLIISDKEKNIYKKQGGIQDEI